MPRDFRLVDPRTLRLEPQMHAGADPDKLKRQIGMFGSSIQGMPPVLVCQASDGVLVVYDGVTRATRIGMLAPGTLITVEVIDILSYSFPNEPTIGDLIP